MPDEILDTTAAKQSVEWLVDYLGRAWVELQLTRRQKLKENSGHWLPPRLHPNRLIDLFACYQEELAGHGDLVFERSAHARCLVTQATSVKHVDSKLDRDSSLRLRSLLRNEATVEGFLYQARISAHYVRAGTDLISFSLGGDSEGDVIVGGTGGEVELQCKSLKYGVGRKIANADFARLGTEVIDACFESGKLVVIEIRCRHRYDSKDRSRLLEKIRDALNSRGDVEIELEDYLGMVTFRDTPIPWNHLEIARQPDSDKPLARPHIAFLGYKNPHDRDELRALLSMRSEKEDRVVEAILRRVKQAAGQMSSERPNVIFVHIPEVIPWESIRSSGYFEWRLAQITSHPSCKRVSALVFTSESPTRDGNYEGYSLANRKAAVPLPAGFEILRGVVAGGRLPEG